MVARTGAAWLLGTRGTCLAAPPRIEPPSSLACRATTRPYLAQVRSTQRLVSFGWELDFLQFSQHHLSKTSFVCDKN